MATNKERTSSAAMRKLLLQSASKKEQEIQQIGSVAESTIPQPAIEQPIHEEVKESAPVTETVQEPQPEQMEKPESKPSVQSSPKTEESKVCGKKFSEYLEERKLKNTEVIRISSETHRKLKQIAMATGLGMHNIANNILEDVLTSHNKEIQAILKKYMKPAIRDTFTQLRKNPFAYYPGQYVKEFKLLLVSTSKFFPKVRIR